MRAARILFVILTAITATATIVATQVAGPAEVFSAAALMAACCVVLVLLAGR